MIKTLGLFFALSIAVFMLAMGGAYYSLQDYLDTPMLVGEQRVDFSLPKGGSLISAAHDLHRQGVLERPRWLTIYSRISGLGKSVKAGEYTLEPGMTPRQLLEKLESGDVKYYQLTLVEGWTVHQMLEALQSKTNLQKKLSKNAADNLASTLGIDSPRDSLEGLFFPDTYRFHNASSDIDLLRQAHYRLQDILALHWQQRDKGLPYSSAYQALVMASLVEKETAVAAEREIIAGVFVRRLRLGMRLQTDPAVIFGLGAGFDGNLRSRHLKDSSNVYNTYRHGGLPPTPIALVGREAIYAALHPADGNALYFVAKGDGTHYFSATLKEHQKAVRKYQIFQRRKNYSSTPIPASASPVKSTAEKIKNG